MSDQWERLLALLETSGVKLHALLTRLTLRPEVAEDLLQELFLKLSRLQGLSRVQDLAGYASRAAMHLAFDWRRQQIKAQPANSLTAEPEANTPSPLTTLIRREELAQVLSALDALPPQSRDCLVWHYLQQWSYEAIAGQLGKTPHQVRALCYKAIVRLRALIPVQPIFEGSKEPSHDNP